MSQYRDFSRRAADRSYRAPLATMFDAVFADLPRRDQRERAAQYVRGLLESRGRKSVRNIAQVAGSAAEQRLHHFVASSPWAWPTVRERLACYVEHHLSPTAWVVRPIIIPKSGERSVGVQRRWFPAAGQVMRAQHALGVWATSDTAAWPVEWRLQLTERWATDAARRDAAIPDRLGAETVAECVVAACADTPSTGPARPFVVDVPEADPSDVVHRLARNGVPFLVRVPPGLRLVAEDPPAGYESGTHAASRIARAVRERARPVPLERPDGTIVAGLACAVGVRLPGRTDRSPDGPVRDLRLFARGRSGPDWPPELWLTNVAGAGTGTLMGWSGMSARADEDCARITDEVGIRDFTGRSFGGWHRHATLVSAAHVVRAQSAPDPTPTPVGTGGPMPVERVA